MSCLRQQVSHVRLPIQAPDTTDDTVHLLIRSSALEGGEAPGFGLYLLAPQRVPGVPLRDVDAGDDPVSAGSLYLHEPDPALRIGRVDVGVEDHLDPLAEPAQLRVLERLLGKVVDPGTPLAAIRASTNPIENLDWWMVRGSLTGPSTSIAAPWTRARTPAI